MRMNSFITKTTAVAAVVLLLNSCKKEADLPAYNPLTKDAAQAELFANAIINQDVVLSNRVAGVDYIIGRNIEVNARLTIEPGTTIMFQDGGGIQVNEQGAITAIGEANNLIYFTSQSGKRGAWRGITVLSNSAHNVLSYCKMEHGGGLNPLGSGNVVIGSGNNTAWLEVSHSQVLTSKTDGISVSKGSKLNYFENNQINTNSAYSITMYEQDAFAVSPTNEFVNNGKQGINLLSNQ